MEMLNPHHIQLIMWLKKMTLITVVMKLVRGRRERERVSERERKRERESGCERESKKEVRSRMVIRKGALALLQIKSVFGWREWCMSSAKV